MKLQIARVPVPELEFGGPGYFHDPRLGLMRAGPFDIRFGAAHKAQIRAAVVGPAELHPTVAGWLLRCRGEILPIDASGSQLPFLGFTAIFRSELVVEPTWYLSLDAKQIQDALGLRPYAGLESIVALYAVAIEQAYQDYRPDVVVCAISDAIEKPFWSVQQPLSPAEKAALRRATKHAVPDQLELPLNWEPEEDTEDLLRRDPRRALKEYVRSSK